AAAAAQLRPGDRILSVEGAPIRSWNDLKSAIEQRGGEDTTFTIERHGRTVDVQATPGVQGGQGFLGVSPGTRSHSLSPIAAIPQGIRSVGDVTAATAKGLAHIFTPAGVSQYSKNFTSNAPKAGSAADLNRPRSIVGIVDEGSTAVQGNIWNLLYLLGS